MHVNGLGKWELLLRKIISGFSWNLNSLRAWKFLLFSELSWHIANVECCGPCMHWGEKTRWYQWYINKLCLRFLLSSESWEKDERIREKSVKRKEWGKGLWALPVTSSCLKASQQQQKAMMLWRGWRESESERKSTKQQNKKKKTKTKPEHTKAIEKSSLFENKLGLMLKLQQPAQCYR